MLLKKWTYWTQDVYKQAEQVWGVTTFYEISRSSIFLEFATKLEILVGSFLDGISSHPVILFLEGVRTVSQTTINIKYLNNFKRAIRCEIEN